MLNLDSSTLAAIVDQARRDAVNRPRWLRAIDRAVTELETNPYIARQDDHLLIASPSGHIYRANGSCECTAYLNGIPCWHRAAARLVQRHDAAHTETRGRSIPSYGQALAQMNELFA